MSKTQTAITTGQSVFQYKITDTVDYKSHLNIFKVGKSNKKLGWKISKGIWKSLPIYSLTLEERKTCPVTCRHWGDCFGNNMPFAVRFVLNESLFNRIDIDLNKLMAKHQNGIALRLHVLGDFGSLEYVKVWENMLNKYPMIKIFGFTAYSPTDKIKENREIGKELASLRVKFAGRFQIRISGGGDIEYSANPINDGFTGFTCPEQTSKVASCASCGICWTSKKNVNFITH